MKADELKEGVCIHDRYHMPYEVVCIHEVESITGRREVFVDIVPYGKKPRVCNIKRVRKNDLLSEYRIL